MTRLEDEPIADDLPVLDSVPVKRLDEDEQALNGSDEDDSPILDAPKGHMEKRRAQKAIFETWLQSDAAKEARKPKARLDDRELADEQLSIHSLMAKQQDAEPLIKHARDYQIELFERAKEQNVIACLSTGSGKTLVAALLLKWIIENELEDRAAGKQPRIAFFLVASVTLALQQYEVLRHNLTGHDITRLYGALGADRLSKDRWDNYLNDNKVIVCTAEILSQALSHSYVNMKQINLLIFDEAHHAKKNHSYARIIKDYFLPEPEATRPRVFGMTASPIDAKGDLRQAANELESILHCKIVTTDNMSFCKTKAAIKLNEQVMPYDALGVPFETEFHKKLFQEHGHVASIREAFSRSKELAAHLGRWCADQYLVESIGPRKLRRLEIPIMRKYNNATSDQEAIAQLDVELKQLRDASRFAHDFPIAPLTATLNDLSSKVLCLRYYLLILFERESDGRCIVFVEKRHVARLLAGVFQQVGNEHLKCAYLIGSGNASLDEDSFSMKEQVLSLNRFRKGEINCLFATSVAEEGLDVPDCNIVIRFDVCNTMIKYVQSRGRARHANSKFYHMVEKGNHLQANLVHSIRIQERQMDKFCKELPEDRKLSAVDDSLEYMMSKEKGKGLQVYKEPSTGAKLTFWTAPTVLATLVSAIPPDEDDSDPPHPVYRVRSHGMKFKADVTLPGRNTPLSWAEGAVCSQKSLAKRSAAFNACIELRKRRFLDEHFMPTYVKKMSALRNALLAVDNKGNTYAMKAKPSVWEQTRGTLPNELWLTVLDFPDGLERPHRPLVMLTRTPIPQLPEFPVYLNDGRESRVVLQRLTKAMAIGGDGLKQLSAFTWRVFKDVFSKQYEEDHAQLSYWLAPASSNCLGPNQTGMPSALIDWDLLAIVSATDEYKWSPEMPDDFLADRLFVDTWDGSRKFFSKGVDVKHKATDPVPAGVVKYKHMETILAYSVAIWKKSRANWTWNLDQPVIEAEKIPTSRKNMLASPAEKETNPVTLAFLCPQPFSISLLPPDIATSCFIWPAVVYRIEAYLIALEACSLVGVDCEPGIALAAVTKDSDNSGDHETEQRVKFQHGMGENYERLEFIGDTFLKTVTTMSTFILHPTARPSEEHDIRMSMLCNKTLKTTAIQLKLYEYIRTRSFSRRLWYMEGLKLLRGTGANKEKEDPAPTHSLGDKTIADVCEALIGAAFLSHDRHGAWHRDQWECAIKAVTTLVDSENHKMQRWDDYSAAYRKPAYQTDLPNAAERDLVDRIAKKDSYRFRHPRLLKSAFTHNSQMQRSVPDYDRLEFLGDALLDMASITYLFYKFPDKDPQWLTEHKMAMVSNKFLGSLCVTLGFSKHLDYVSSDMGPAIATYENDLMEAMRVSNGARDYWTTVVESPKYLSDIVESYVGAMFIDSDFDYTQIQRFFDDHVKYYFEDMSIYDTYANKHPCTRLYNLLQVNFGCEDFRVFTQALPDAEGLQRRDLIVAVMIHDRVVSSSTGKSGRYAKERAAHDAVKQMDGLAPFEYRTRFGCDCHVKRIEAEEHHEGENSTGAAVVQQADIGTNF